MIARAFIHHWVYYYGPPDTLLSDNGKQFFTRFFQDICRTQGIKNLFTTTYHPQWNGQVERYNRSLLAAIRHYIEDHPKDWDLYTETIRYAYNTQVHSTTKFAPFDLVLTRRPPALPVELDSKDTVSVELTTALFHLRWWNELRKRAKAAAANMAKARARYKRNYDSSLRKHVPGIRVGGHVIVRIEKKTRKAPEESSDKPKRHKLSPVATGPHEVVEFNEETVVISRGDEVERISRHRVVNAPGKDVMAHAPHAPADAEPSREYTDAHAPAPRRPNSEILDLPPNSSSVPLRTPPGDPNLEHGAALLEHSKPCHGVSCDQVAEGRTPPVQSTNAPRDVDLPQDSQTVRAAATWGKNTTVREEPPIEAEEGKSTVMNLSPNDTVGQQENSTVISGNVSTGENKKADQSSREATVSEAVVERPRSKQKTVSVHPTPADAAYKGNVSQT